MASDAKWYFTAEQLGTSPSRKCGMDADQELIYRQRAANLIQDMGQRLHVSQLCINTAIVYMHRFYAFHSFTKFHRNSIAAAALFLAAKVEEQPRKLEHVIKVANICLNADHPETSKETYPDQAQDLVFNENVLLQTLGFDVAIDHPHTHVVKTCHLVKASKDLAQTSYFMASNSLHLTTMCLQYKPTVVACFCIHLACQWSRWEIPQSTEGKHWFHYVDKTVTLDLLKQLTEEFLHIFDKCPSRLKSKMKSISATAHAKEGGMPVGNAATAKFEDNPTNHQKHHDRPHHHHARKVHEKGAGHSSSSGEAKSQQPSTSHKSSNPTAGTSTATNVKRPRSEAPSATVTSATSSSQSLPANPPNKTQEASERPRSQQRHPHQEGSSSGAKSRPGYPPPSQKSSSGSEQRHPVANAKAQSETNPVKSSKNPAEHKSSQPSKSYPHPAAFNQANSSNNRISTNQDAQSASTSVPQHQQQHQQHTKPQPETSTFRLTDDSNRLSESMQICTPPKQSSKPTSIFSPDWEDSEPAPLVNLVPKRPPSNSSSIFNAKPKTDSPKKEKHRSETPHKKEKKSSDQPTTPTSQKQRPPGPADSKKVKNLPNPQISLQQQPQVQDIKQSSQSQKRSFSSTQDQIKQEDGVDFREQKVRKLDSNLFGQDLLENIFDVKPTKQLPPQLFNTNSDSNSQFDQFDAFNSIKESKPLVKTFSDSQLVNGIETNPDYVKSLLQESFSSNDMKFTSSLNTLNPITPMGSMSSLNSFSNLSTVKKLHDTSSGYGSLGQISSELPETLLEPSPVELTEPTLGSEEGDHHHRNKSKKKKDKHKHKDRSKDKEERSKDKEERKKHKKDKERKEREKEDPGPLKMIFSKGDTEATGPFKIKIPKESIRGELGAPQSSPTPPSSLKIKISNYGNKFYNNNNDAAANAATTGITGNTVNSVNVAPLVPAVAPTVHKKKEREKERKDRSKGKHNNNNVPEFNKANGAGGVQPQMQNPPQNLINNQRQMQTNSAAQQLMGLPPQPLLSTTLPNSNKMPPIQIPSQNYNQMFNSNYQNQQNLQQQQQQNYNNYYQNNNYANNSTNQNKSNSVNK